jgi:thimet oligopeptidase
MSPIYLLGSVSPLETVRNSSNIAISELSKFYTDLSLNEDLYKIIKKFSETDEAKNIQDEKYKFLKETIENFERNGFALDKHRREILKRMENKLTDYSIKFHKNIADANFEMFLTEDELDGLPEDYKKQHLQENGKYKITLDYPSLNPFLKYAKNDKLREKLYFEHLNKAKIENEIPLDNILIFRNKKAHLLGYKTYAEYALENKMAKKPETVWNFEKNLSEKVREKAQKDYNELLKIKQKSDPNVEKINSWEKSFLNNVLLKENYSLDQEEIKQYFELDQTLAGLFEISEKLFDLKIIEIFDFSKWHEDVRLFEVYKNNKLSGRFYLDLYPRKNKYSHAACFDVVEGKRLENEYQIPTATLVCNFPKANKNIPSLLYHSDVETLFHEFGHALHNVLTEAEFSVFSGTSVARDFVETPSQLMENWAWNYDSLKLFAKHHTSGEILPKELHKKMLAAKNVGSGLHTQQQLFYGKIDMTLHDKFDPETEETGDVVKKLQNEETLFPFMEGTHFERSFGHLDGYAAGYYGYLWALVYSDDFFSEFEKNGILNSETGKRFRDIVLVRGGSEDEIELVKKFLGREPNEEAFLKALGI